MNNNDIFSNELIKFLHDHSACEKKTSSEVTYDKFAHDPEFSKMYQSDDEGVFKKMSAERVEDWSKKIIINLFREEIRNRGGNNPKVLDIGSGTGFPALYISDLVSSVVSYDGSVELQKLAARNVKTLSLKNVDIVHGTAEKLPFENESFDIVVMSHFIEFSYNAVECIKEISRVLKKNGYVIGLSINWKMMINKRLGYLGEKKILYPHSKAEKKQIQGIDYLKYRICKLDPSFEMSFYIDCADKFIIPLVELINKGYLKLAVEVLRRIEDIKIELAICHQYTDKTILDLYKKGCFEIEAFHDVRLPITNFLDRLIADEEFRFDFFEDNFELLTKHMVELTKNTSSEKGFDMFVVAKKIGVDDIDN